MNSDIRTAIAVSNAHGLAFNKQYQHAADRTLIKALDAKQIIHQSFYITWFFIKETTLGLDPVFTSMQNLYILWQGALFNEQISHQ